MALDVTSGEYESLVQKTETVEVEIRGEAKSSISPEMKSQINDLWGAICEALRGDAVEQAFILAKSIVNECCDALENGNKEVLKDAIEVGAAGIEMAMACGGALVRYDSESST